MITGANLSFKFRLMNADGSVARHSDFLDVIVYVYVYADKVVKFSKSDRYENRLTAIDDYFLRVDLSPEQTRSLGEGMPKFSVYTAVHATVEILNNIARALGKQIAFIDATDIKREGAENAVSSTP